MADLTKYWRLDRWSTTLELWFDGNTMEYSRKLSLEFDSTEKTKDYFKMIVDKANEIIGNVGSSDTSLDYPADPKGV